jgi:methylated-DNA-[protein]-cysteine S-methyltransferase
MITYAEFPTPVGAVTVLSENGCIIALWLPQQKCSVPAGAVMKITPELSAIQNWLQDYFAGIDPQMDIPLSPKGTPFQHNVWKLLLQIPYGESLTYGAIAKHFGPRMSAQAVGQAVGKNPICLLIPCHRVLGTGGKLTGYAAGTDVKRFLLELEGIPWIEA